MFRFKRSPLTIAIAHSLRSFFVHRNKTRQSKNKKTFFRGLGVDVVFSFEEIDPRVAGAPEEPRDRSVLGHVVFLRWILGVRVDPIICLHTCTHGQVGLHNAFTYSLMHLCGYHRTI